MIPQGESVSLIRPLFQFQVWSLSFTIIYSRDSPLLRSNVPRPPVSGSPAIKVEAGGL